MLHKVSCNTYLVEIFMGFKSSGENMYVNIELHIFYGNLKRRLYYKEIIVYKRKRAFFVFILNINNIYNELVPPY